MSTEIHPTAVLDKGAELGENVTVGPYAVIHGKTFIGDDCRIESFAQIKSGTRIGKNNFIDSYACIGGDPQDLKYKGEETVLNIGNHNIIREYVTINRGTSGGGGVTNIGSNCLIMAYAHIAHDCQLSDEVILANAATLAGHVIIKEKAVVGGLSAVHQFVRIGEYAYIGGMTGVGQDVPPYMMVAGERGWLHGLNFIGLKRWGFQKERIFDLKQAYKLIWRSGLKKDHALDRALEDLGHKPEVKTLVDFLRTSERGVIGPRNE